MTDQQLPTPDRIRSYLRSRGWREETRLPPAGVMFSLAAPTVSGQPLTVFAPELQDAFDYPLAVAAVVETLAAFEDRPKAAIRADMLATNPAPTASASDKSPTNGSATAPKGVSTP
jgi:hypothetical protein